MNNELNYKLSMLKSINKYVLFLKYIAAVVEFNLNTRSFDILIKFLDISFNDFDFNVKELKPMKIVLKKKLIKNFKTLIPNICKL